MHNNGRDLYIMGNYKVSWSKDGSLRHSQESEAMTLGEALAFANEKIALAKPKIKTVTILKESQPPNKGKFFLYQIIK
jgi:hypothetical protein